MNRERTLAERVSSIEGVGVGGTFLRHAAPGRDALAGGFGGRWGAELSVIYVGRPYDSCVEEAYRHLVDETGVPAEYVKARTLYTVEVKARNILDLRDAKALDRVGLTEDDLYSDVGDYEACQRVASAAHQLEFHGIYAPAATKLGDTLALFKRRVQAAERPVIVEETAWAKLPDRPGSQRARLFAVKD